MLHTFRNTLHLCSDADAYSKSAGKFLYIYLPPQHEIEIELRSMVLKARRTDGHTHTHTHTHTRSGLISHFTYAIEDTERRETWKPKMHKRCDYEVPGMILLRDLKGVMRLDRSKDTSVRVSVGTSYDFNALTPVVWKFRWWKFVWVSTSRHKKLLEQILELWIDIKFCAKLGNNVSGDCAVLSKAYGGGGSYENVKCF